MNTLLVTRFGNKNPLLFGWDEDNNDPNRPSRVIQNIALKLLFIYYERQLPYGYVGAEYIKHDPFIIDMFSLEGNFVDATLLIDEILQEES